LQVDWANHKPLRQNYLLAKGTHGYFALFNWTKLYISPIGDRAMLVYFREASRSRLMMGEIAIISPCDTRLRSRYVRWLSSADFRRASV